MSDYTALMEFLTEHFNRLEARIDNMITRREHEIQQKDIDRAHEKHRELEVRVRNLEVGQAKDQSGHAVRWGVVAKVAGVVITLMTMALAMWLGLR